MTFEELQNKITELNFSNIKFNISNKDLNINNFSINELKRLFVYTPLLSEMMGSKLWELNIQNTIDEDTLMNADLSYEYDGDDQ